MVEQNQINDKLNMLVVDDEQAILGAIKGLFRRDYQVFTANSGEDALELLQQQDVTMHLILTDQRMPKMNGYELLGKIQKLYSQQSINILMTGYTDIDDLIKAVNEGHIFGYVTKPWNPSDLRILVSKAASLCRLQLEKEYLTKTLAQQTQERAQELKNAQSSFLSFVKHLKSHPQNQQALLDKLEASGENALPNLTHFLEMHSTI